MYVFAEAIQDLIVEKGFVKLIPKLLHIEFAELQYNTGQIVYNLVGHGKCIINRSRVSLIRLLRAKNRNFYRRNVRQLAVLDEISRKYKMVYHSKTQIINVSIVARNCRNRASLWWSCSNIS